MNNKGENGIGGNGGDMGVISVIGLGYIGLPTAAMFASAGHSVIGVDVSQRAVDAVNAGSPHIEETGLSELVHRCVTSGRLRATGVPEAADSFIIAVPTPVDHVTHVPDTTYVEAAARSIGPVLKKGDLIVLESTSPVGTTRRIAQLLAEMRPDLVFPIDGKTSPDVHLAYCPERIIPGRMLIELVENDRIIGGMTAACTKRATALYSSFVKGDCLPSDDRTAELCKLTENSFRDVNIAFANELSMICGQMGLDVWKVIQLANHHPRVNILNPGPGVGGHCIAVDPWFIVAGAPEQSRIIRTAREVNDEKPAYVVRQVAEAMKGRPGARIVCLGLTYKADVDDFRESPALTIARELAGLYPGQVIGVDPYIDALAHSGEPVGELVFGKVDDALSGADLAVMLVPHTTFRGLRPGKDAITIDPVGFWRT